MIDINLCPDAMMEFNQKVLELEKESINNLNQIDDSQMVNRIIRIYEEVKAKYENK